MAQKVERFEDLIAWQKARQLTAEIYRITAHGEFAKDFGLREQIRRATVSVMSNIAEVRSQLYVALDVGYIDQETFGTVNNSASELLRIIGGLRAAVQKQRDQK